MVSKANKSVNVNSRIVPDRQSEFATSDARQETGKPQSSATSKYVPGHHVIRALAHRANPLHVSVSRRRDEAVFVADYTQLPLHCAEQLTWQQQECRVGRFPDSFVSDGKSFVDQAPTRRNRRQQLRPQRPMQVIGDNHRVEYGICGQRPRATLDVCDDGFRDASEPSKCCGIPINAGHTQATCREPACMPTAATGHIQHGCAGRQFGRPVRHPSGWRGEHMRIEHGSGHQRR